jgi:hypothetical protein
VSLVVKDGVVRRNELAGTGAAVPTAA